MESSPLDMGHEIQWIAGINAPWTVEDLTDKAGQPDSIPCSATGPSVALNQASRINSMEQGKFRSCWIFHDGEDVPLFVQ